MDILAELENMALRVDHDDDDELEFEETAQKWSQLFQLSIADARQKLDKHRNDFSRVNVSDEHWEMVQSENEAKGYDREAYEFSMTQIVIGEKDKPYKPAEKASYLLKLDGPLDTVAKVQEAAGLESPPAVFQGTGDAGHLQVFCRIDGAAKTNILNRLNETNDRFRPTFISVSAAEKNLCPFSKAPTLAIDSTMPQHRLSTLEATPLPAQDQYPVWYFFYGTLADPSVLSALLGLTQPPQSRQASVNGGELTTWAGKYKALVDGASEIKGSAYQVISREQEDALRYYETAKYEVVRCRITMHNGEEEVPGLTFRFCG